MGTWPQQAELRIQLHNPPLAVSPSCRLLTILQAALTGPALLAESVQVLLHGIGAVLVLTLIVLK